MAVIGDIMLDIYEFGDVCRISPEAPVPVLSRGERKYYLGGAGNVAANIASIRGECDLICGFSCDEYWQKLDVLAKERSINLLPFDKTQICTTVKTRFVASGSHILRVDQEILENLGKPSALESLKVSAIYLSDYNKGALYSGSSIVDELKTAGKYVIVDPKTNDWNRYRGADVIKPNERELCAVLGLSSFRLDDMEKAQLLCSYYNISNVIVTLGKDGAVWFDRNSHSIFRAPQQTVYDVVGAGDTFGSALYCALADGIQMNDAIQAAVNLASKAVSHSGLYVPSAEEYQQSLKSVIGCDAASKRKVVFTNGCFDILHSGHVQLLKQARELGDYLIVGLNSDSSVAHLKGADRPFNKEADRKIILESLRFVDEVVIFEEATPENLIKSIKPQILVKGGDYTAEQVIGKQIVESYNGQVVILPFLDGYSTTKILEQYK